MTDAYVALVLAELHFPEAGSLKTKRKDLKSVSEQLRQRLHVSVAEVDGQDTWQRSTLSIALTSGSMHELNRAADRVERFLYDRFQGDVRISRSCASANDLSSLG
jgi:uncharacterized protein YlxP (DUF503 family)